VQSVESVLISGRVLVPCNALENMTLNIQADGRPTLAGEKWAAVCNKLSGSLKTENSLPLIYLILVVYELKFVLLLVCVLIPQPKTWSRCTWSSVVINYSWTFHFKFNSLWSLSLAECFGSMKTWFGQPQDALPDGLCGWVPWLASTLLLISLLW